jgi:putative NIF3 family GTP cyclohydrolase 1 type 2/GNAT superfamily N-acetyltransferase
MLHVADIKDKLHEPRVLAVLSEAAYKPTPEKLLQKAETYENDSAVVAFGSFDGGEVTGVIVLRRHEGEGFEILSIAAAPAYRSAGIGSGLITHAVNHLRCDGLYAETDDDAVGFYRKYGFKITSLGEKYPGTVRYLCTLNTSKKELIKRLDEDFLIDQYQDVWNRFDTADLMRYLTPGYRQYGCGLMLDFAEDIREVITATFVTDSLIHFIKDQHKKDVLIFTHHPYYQEERDYAWHDAISKNLDILKENRIAIYVCHLALDFHPTYSTALYMAKALISKIDGRLTYEEAGAQVSCEYYGPCVDNLFEKIGSLSSKVRFYQFGETKPHIVCCSPGGGNILEVIRLAKETGVDTYITGVSEFRGKNSIARNKDFFKALEEIGINVIGLGHYETECLAMRALVEDYFKSIIDQAAYFEEPFV